MALVGKIVWVVGIVAWYIIRYPFQRKARREQVVLQRRSLGERLGLAAAAVGLALMPGLYVAIGFPASATYPAQAWAVLPGAPVYAAALWLFYRSHKDLGRNWSITLEIRERHRLVCEGVYRSIRHPMYTSFLLMAAGQALLLSNWAVGLAGFAGFFIFFFMRADAEESMMIQTFGEEYRAYMARTYRIIPHVY